MSNSGIEDFQAVDDDTLYEGMRIAARLRRIVAVHAENDRITAARTARAIASNRRSAQDYLDSRPIVAELEAINRAIFFAAETGAALHIVHVSTGRGVAMVAAARAQGVNVSCETCPHYLVFTDEDLERIGPLAKCAPPLRPSKEREALWQHLANGTLPMVASDHSPAPASMKSSEDFFQIWGGISGCQSTLQLLLTEGARGRHISLATIARATSTAIAERFGLAPRKGRLAIGADADLALVNLEAAEVLHAKDLRYRHQHSPYLGRALQGRVCRIILRGQTILQEGVATRPPIGRLITPS